MIGVVLLLAIVGVVLLILFGPWMLVMWGSWVASNREQRDK